MSLPLQQTFLEPLLWNLVWYIALNILESWIRFSLRQQFSNILVSWPLYTLENLSRTSKNFYFCGIKLSIFTILEIKQKCWKHKTIGANQRCQRDGIISCYAASRKLHCELVNEQEWKRIAGLSIAIKTVWIPDPQKGLCPLVPNYILRTTAVKKDLIFGRRCLLEPCLVKQLLCVKNEEL